MINSFTNTFVALIPNFRFILKYDVQVSTSKCIILILIYASVNNVHQFNIKFN